MGSLEKELLDLIRDVYNTIGWPGVIGLMAVESVFFPIPSEVVMPLSGWMLIADKGHSAWLVLLAGFYGALGSLIGALIIYAVGAWGGRPLLERYGRYVLITSADLDTANRWFDRYGTWAVFLSRLVPVARSLISLPAGVTRMPLIPFILLTFVGSFIWSLGLAYAGYQLGDNWESIRDVMRPVEIPILIVVVLLVAYYVYRHVRQLRSGLKDSREAETERHVP